ncbi:MAG: hypothetical protein ACKOCK_10490 [Chloroflexota bacterium]
MNALNDIGLDMKSVLVGAGLVLVGMIAVSSAPLIPVVLVGGLVYLLGANKGWWGSKRAANTAAAAAAAQQAVVYQWPPQWGPAPYGHPAYQGPAAAPTEPVNGTPTPDSAEYRRTVGM